MPHSLDYVFRDVARHLNVDFSYVEKDWYAVKVLSVISELDVPIVFTGGTSLSKGHGLIERFSEDLDFRICLKDKLSRKKRREIRSKIFNAINSIHDISVLEETISSKNEGKFFSANVSYPKFFSLKESLRSNLKLEFSFEPVELDITFEEIRSFVNEYLLEYTDDQPDIDCKIKTISPIETGANKYSALIWRIFVRDRSAKEGSAKNDSTMVRHLHDLFALKNLLLNSEEFSDLVLSSFLKDVGRSGSDKSLSLKEYSENALKVLNVDPLYESEYEKFVSSMSYADDSEKIKFEQALRGFEVLVEKVNSI